MNRNGWFADYSSFIHCVVQCTENAVLSYTHAPEVYPKDWCKAYHSHLVCLCVIANFLYVEACCFYLRIDFVCLEFFAWPAFDIRRVPLFFYMRSHRIASIINYNWTSRLLKNWFNVVGSFNSPMKINTKPILKRARLLRICVWMSGCLCVFCF